MVYYQQSLHEVQVQLVHVVVDVGRELLEQHDINSKEEISAILATNELAQKLRIKNNDPILFRKRLVSDVANRILEYNFCYYLASDFKYEITIKRPN